MANDRPLPPSIIWAQRNDKLYVTVNLEDCSNPTIKFEDNSVFFQGVGGVDKKTFEVKIEFHKEIVPKDSHYAVLDRHIPMVIIKKDAGFWPRLRKDTTKCHWLKTDFDKWRDEDDSDADDDKDMQFEDMMKKMGNFNASGGGEEIDEGEPDSDDEELPDLE